MYKTSPKMKFDSLYLGNDQDISFSSLCFMFCVMYSKNHSSYLQIIVLTNQNNMNGKNFSTAEISEFEYNKTPL